MSYGLLDYTMPILISTIALLSVLIVWLLLRRQLKRLVARFFSRLDIPPVDQCKCGYPLKGLDLARCPECGRVLSFDATPEQLGLGPDELARIQQKRREREK